MEKKYCECLRPQIAGSLTCIVCGGWPSKPQEESGGIAPVHRAITRCCDVCWYYDGTWYGCENSDCPCHLAPPEKRRDTTIDPGTHVIHPEGAEKLFKPYQTDGGRIVSTQFDGAEPSLAGQGGWEKAFDEARPEQGWMPKQVSREQVSRAEQSPVTYFGYKYFSNGFVHEVTDWAHIKSFIRTLISRKEESWGIIVADITRKEILKELAVELEAKKLEAENFYGSNPQAALSDILTWIRGRLGV